MGINRPDLLLQAVAVEGGHTTEGPNRGLAYLDPVKLLGEDPESETQKWMARRTAQFVAGMESNLRPHTSTAETDTLAVVWDAWEGGDVDEIAHVLTHLDPSWVSLLGRSPRLVPGWQKAVEWTGLVLPPGEMGVVTVEDVDILLMRHPWTWEGDEWGYVAIDWRAWGRRAVRPEVDRTQVEQILTYAPGRVLAGQVEWLVPKDEALHLAILGYDALYGVRSGGERHDTAPVYQVDMAGGKRLIQFPIGWVQVHHVMPPPMTPESTFVPERSPPRGVLNARLTAHSGPMRWGQRYNVTLNIENQLLILKNDYLTPGYAVWQSGLRMPVSIEEWLDAYTDRNRGEDQQVGDFHPYLFDGSGLWLTHFRTPLTHRPETP